MTISQTAESFFNDLEGGKGWEVCKAYCQPGATFSCQADMLAETTSVEAYAGWIQGLFTPIPDMHPDIQSLATDTERGHVTIFAVVKGTQTGEGGPVPPTGNKVAADYVYDLAFKDGKISHMTKIWNDGYTLKLLGWA